MRIVTRRSLTQLTGLWCVAALATWAVPSLNVVAIADCQSPAATTPVTVTDETASVPNSRMLVNGTNTSVDTSTAGQVKVNASLPSSGVTAGTYSSANVTVNSQGIVTSASNGTPGTGTTVTPITAGNVPATVPNLIVPANGLLQALPFDHSLTAMASGIEYTVPTASSGPVGSCAGPDGNVWFTENSVNKIGKLSPTGTFTEYSVPTASSAPSAICAGPDGNLWFTESSGNKVAKVTTGGSFTEYSIPTTGANAIGICTGPDGNLWFAENSTNKIGKVTPSGSFTEYTVTTSGSQPWGICAGPEGNLWFTEANGNNIGKITTSGSVTEYSITTSASNPHNICTGSDGNLWFCEYSGNKVGKITVSGTVTEYSVPTTGASPYGICAGADGNLWFCEYSKDKLASISTIGTISEYSLPSTSTGASYVCVGPDGNLWLTEQSTSKIATWQFTVSGTTPILNSVVAGTNVTISRTATGISIAAPTPTSGMGGTTRQWMPCDNGSAITQIGILNLHTTTCSGLAFQTGTDGTLYSLSTLNTASTSGSSIAQYGPTGADLTSYQSSPIVTTVVSAGRTTNCRVWVALVPNAVSIAGTDTPHPDVLAFRYSTSAGDTHWNTYTSSHASVNTAVDTGVSVSANQPDVLTIDASNAASVKFYINGTLVDTRTTNLPSTTATTEPYVSFTNLTTTALSGYNGIMTITTY